MSCMYIKAVAVQSGLQNTYSCLLKTENNQLYVKNLEKSTELSEFLKLGEVCVRCIPCMFVFVKADMVLFAGNTV